jgi:hypothetical protein
MRHTRAIKDSKGMAGFIEGRTRVAKSSVRVMMGVQKYKHGITNRFFRRNPKRPAEDEVDERPLKYRCGLNRTDAVPRHGPDSQEPGSWICCRFSFEDGQTPENKVPLIEDTVSPVGPLHPEEEIFSGRIGSKGLQHPECIKCIEGICGIGLFQPVMAVSTLLAPPFGNIANSSISFNV